MVSSVGLPFASTVFWTLPIEAVGLTAARQTIGNPVLIPPETLAELDPLDRSQGEHGLGDSGVDLSKHGIAQAGRYSICPDLHDAADRILLLPGLFDRLFHGFGGFRVGTAHL
jgi:hypothetical protein